MSPFCEVQHTRLSHSERFIFHYGDIISIWHEARFVSGPLTSHLSTQGRVLLSRHSSSRLHIHTATHIHTWELLSASAAIYCWQREAVFEQLRLEWAAKCLSQGHLNVIYWGGVSHSSSSPRVFPACPQIQTFWLLKLLNFQLLFLHILTIKNSEKIVIFLHSHISCYFHALAKEEKTLKINCKA